MGYKKPIHVKKEDVRLHHTYYTLTYGGVIKVIILKLLDNETKALVKTNKGNPFVRELKFIFIDGESAKLAVRDWEHDERKRKKKRK